MPAIFILVVATVQLKAQGATDVLRYSLQYPTYDPVTIVIPGVSSATGFGAYQENPASMALFKEGFVSFGLSSRFVNEESTYLGTSSEFDDNETNVGNLGFLYKVPTTRGSLVFGGGYSQSTDYNRALSVNARNDESTLTDFYASFPTDNPLNEAAFEAFAIDDVFVVDNGDTTVVSQSIFRFLPEGVEYPGINQNMELTERGVLGEYSAFFATEFQENFMLGASIGIMNGSYKYRRDFLETDRFDDYDGQFIDSDDDGEPDTDIESILSEDIIDARFSGFSARLGFIYQPTSNINVGGSYQFRNTLHVDEDFSTQITTNLDNGSDPFFGEDLGEISYKVKRPDRLNLGVTFHETDKFNLSVAAELVRYSQATIEFEVIELSEDENFINDTVESSFNDVVNFRAGLEYTITPLFTPRVGYAYYPSTQDGVSNERQFFSGGFSAQLFDNVSFDLGIQYSIWEDENQLYDYFEGNELVSEIAAEDVTRWNVMGGIKIDL